MYDKVRKIGETAVDKTTDMGGKIGMVAALAGTLLFGNIDAAQAQEYEFINLSDVDLGDDVAQSESVLRANGDGYMYGLNTVWDTEGEHDVIGSLQLDIGDATVEFHGTPGDKYGAPQGDTNAELSINYRVNNYLTLNGVKGDEDLIGGGIALDLNGNNNPISPDGGMLMYVDDGDDQTLDNIWASVQKHWDDLGVFTGAKIEDNTGVGIVSLPSTDGFALRTLHVALLDSDYVSSNISITNESTKSFYGLNVANSGAFTRSLRANAGQAYKLPNSATEFNITTPELGIDSEERAYLVQLGYTNVGDTDRIRADISKYLSSSVWAGINGETTEFEDHRIEGEIGYKEGDLLREGDLLLFAKGGYDTADDDPYLHMGIKAQM